MSKLPAFLDSLWFNLVMVLIAIYAIVDYARSIWLTGNFFPAGVLLFAWIYLLIRSLQFVARAKAAKS